MADLQQLKTQGFKDLFVISSTSTLALVAWFLTNASSALLVLILSLPISFIIYKKHSNSIDCFFTAQRITNKSASELTVACFFAQGLVIGTMFGWAFGRGYFG